MVDEQQHNLQQTQGVVCQSVRLGRTTTATDSHRHKSPVDKFRLASFLHTKAEDKQLSLTSIAAGTVKMKALL